MAGEQVGAATDDDTLDQNFSAESTGKMITNGLELLHPAEEGQPPPSRRLYIGGAGQRRCRGLHFAPDCAGVASGLRKARLLSPLPACNRVLVYLLGRSPE